MIYMSHLVHVLFFYFFKTESIYFKKLNNDIEEKNINNSKQKTQDDRNFT